MLIRGQQYIKYIFTTLGLGFPTGRKFLVLRDKGTVVSSLSWDKGTTGQKSLHCPGTKGQRDKLKILQRDKTGWDSLSKSGTGRGTGQDKILTACPVPSRGTKRDRAEKDVLEQEEVVLKQKRMF
jgi:hypothetical protein